MLLGLAVQATADSPLYGHYGSPSDNGQNTKRVPVSDLDLSRQAGVETLYARLDAAAKSVCGPRQHARELYRHREWKECYSGALGEAVDDVGHQGLTEYHLAQTGRAGNEGKSQVADR